MATHLHLCLIDILQSLCLHLLERKFFWIRCSLFTSSQHSQVPNGASTSRRGIKGQSNGRFEGRHIDFSMWLGDILGSTKSDPLGSALPP